MHNQYNVRPNYSRIFIPSKAIQHVQKAILFILLFIPAFLFGQHPYFQNISSVDGIESNWVYCCFQDKDGFMWFGTDLGASRFNGYAFENFDSENGLLGNEIFSIHQDQQDRIWFLSYNGEFTYYLDGVFYNRENDSTLAQIKSDSYFTSYFEDDVGNVYIASTKSGVFIFDTLNQVRQVGEDIMMYKVWVDENNLVKFFSPDGLYRIEGDSYVLEAPYNLSTHYGRTLLMDDEVIFGFGREIILLGEKLEVIDQLPDETVITWMGHGNGSNVYVGTRTGLYLYDYEQKKFGPEHYCPESIVSYTLIDREGNLWITTLGEGIFLSTSPQTILYNTQGGLPVNNITALKKGSDDDLWIGMRGGYYSHLNDGQINTKRILDHNNQSITRIALTADNQLLIASKSNILLITDQGERYFPFLSNDILVDAGNYYIISKQTFKVPARFFQSRLVDLPNVDRELELDLQDYLLLPINSGVVAKGGGDEMYFGTQKGLYKSIGIEMIDLGKINPALAVTINDLAYDDARKLLYVATSSQGLVVLENDEIKFTFNQENGLSDNNCQSLLLDDGVLWIGTTKSLDMVALDQPQFELISHGTLLNLSATKISDIERINNTLYLATNEGLIAQDLTLNLPKVEVPELLLEAVCVNSVEQNLADQKLTLKHYENSISFTFLGLSYRNLGNLTYEYKLEGFNKEWQQTKSREVLFDALNPGEYVFKVRVKVEGVGVQNAMVIPFEIEQPLWKRTWFICTGFVLALGIILLIWFFRIKNIRANFELEKQIVSSELEKLELEKAYLIAEQKAGVLQMNPHFLFNSLNTIKGYYAQNKFNEANRFISRFSKLLRRILECNTAFIPLEKEIEIVDLYLFLMQKRYNEIFTYSVTSDLDDISDVNIPPMMVQPMVENSVIHGIAPMNRGEVKVHFYAVNSQLACSVKDTGIGFNKSLKQTHESIGLANIRDRLDLLSRQFDIPCSIEFITPNDLENDCGTTVIILFPTKISTHESHNN